MSLQDKLAAMRADTMASLPSHMQKIVDTVIADLIAGGQAERAVKAGALAPSFRLPDSLGRMVSSVDLLAAGPLVLAFYRGTWCSYCKLDLEALEAGHADIRSLGASLVVISQQTPKHNRLAQSSLGIGIPMLSDRGGVVAELFGIRFALPPELRPVFAELNVDLATLNGEASWTLPMPARYVINRNGLVVYSEVNPDYSQRPEPSDLLPVLTRLAHSAVDLE